MAQRGRKGRVKGEGGTRGLLLLVALGYVRSSYQITLMVIAGRNYKGGKELK